MLLCGLSYESDEAQTIRASPCSSTLNMSTQTQQQLSSHSPRKDRLRRRLAVTRVRLWRARSALRKIKKQHKELKAVSHCGSVEHLLKSTEKLLTPDGHVFFATQLRLSSKRPKGRRYTNAMKRLALLLFYKGPTAYSFLSKIFCLPSRTTLTTWMNSVTVLPGFNDDVFSGLEVRVRELQDRDRVCSLIVDEMSLKSNLAYDRAHDVVVGYEDFGSVLPRSALNATSVLTFMVRGLAANWKQPVGFVFTHNACSGTVLKSLLFECLEKLYNIGLHVAVVISDQGSNFQQLCNLLDVSVAHPYFELSGKRYCYMFDPPHLLKSVRNNLQSYTFYFDDGKMASWKEIENFYKIDEQQKFRLAPKLTKKHIELPAFSKMKVKTAAQVLSRTVAAGLDTHARFSNASSSDTAEFITEFDELFDIFNSSQLRCVKEFKRALSGTTHHLDVLRRKTDWLRSLKIVDKHGKDVSNIVKCITGWQLTASAMLLLWPVLRDRYHFQFLFTRRLNQDPIEHFFSVIRQRGGNCDNPSPIYFSRLFKQMCCRSLLTPVVGANCEVELDCASLLEAVNDKTVLPKSLLHENLCSEAVDTPLLAMVCASDSDDDMEANGLYYVCGYLLRRLLKWHCCDECNSMYMSQNTQFSQRAEYTSARQYSARELITGRGLVKVSDSFFFFVTECEDVFQMVFSERSHERNILQTAVQKLMNVQPPVDCTDFPKLKFVTYFTRMRIHYTLKFKNRTLAKDKRKNRKLSKVKHL